MFITNVEAKLVMVAHYACCIFEQIHCALFDTFRFFVLHQIVRHFYDRALECAVSHFSVRERKERKLVPEVNHGTLCFSPRVYFVHAFPIEKCSL